MRILGIDPGYERLGIAVLERATSAKGYGVPRKEKVVFSECFKTVRPGIKEYQLRATLEYALLRKGAVRHGYAPIVASGTGTCILHNPHDRTTIKKNSLVLIDAGAEWEYYSADITRTFPASGTFTKEQRAVYDILLEAQNRAIAFVKPGARLQDIEDKTRDFMAKLLLKKKILVSPRPEPLHTSPLRKGEGRPAIRSLGEGWFPHRLGHWLGMDVHDVGRYDIPLEPGMVLTIEPGIYLPHRFGIRLEDTILITPTGYRRLTHSLFLKL